MLLCVADEVGTGIPPKIIKVTDPFDTRERITGLTPDTDYVINVRSCTKMGCSDPVTAVSGKTVPDGGKWL